MSVGLVVGMLDRVSVDITPDAVARRATLLAEAAEIQTVADEFGQNCAVDVWRELQATAKAVERSRAEVKAPVLDVGRRIDALAREFIEPLTTEAARVNKLVTDYQRWVRERAEEVERLRQAELRKIEAERRAVAEAEARRLVEIARAEAARKQAVEDAETAFSAPEQAAAQAAQAAAEAERLSQVLAAEAERKKLVQLERDRLAAQQAVARTDHKPAGLVVREAWKFEVLDVWQLANARHDLVRLEAHASNINEAIRNGLRQCPGLRIYSETVTEVRS